MIKVIESRGGWGGGGKPLTSYIVRADPHPLDLMILNNLLKLLKL